MRRLPISERRPVIVIGAGVAGLASALVLAAGGVPTVVIESAAGPGGKMGRARLAGQCFDAGPTVLTMRWVFEELFAEAGASFERDVPTRAATILARHAWPGNACLDLYADAAASAEQIGHFAGAGEADRFLRFCEQARATYRALEHDFIRAQRPSVGRLVAGVTSRRPADLLAIRPFETLWRSLQRYFGDPRLQQLFGRYATYCGSSPFDAPATLMLVAHVEQEGVWLVDPGMYRIAEAMEQLAAGLGARFRYGAQVERIGTDADGVCNVQLEDGEVLAAAAIVVNADAAALAQGCLGPAAARAAGGADRLPRSLSAVTWQVLARTAGFPMLRHNVFFSGNYQAEFDALFRARSMPAEATIYVCAQDRGAAGADPVPEGAEKLLCLINAPADGDRPMPSLDGQAATDRVFGRLEQFGLRIEWAGASVQQTTPPQFAQRYPGTGGALYGSATHGWRASFARPGASTAVPGLYLAGGSIHPGPGVPMAALSGRLAARCVLAHR
jgi:1-hydroxycarotenoid 3,4-desaturase